MYENSARSVRGVSTLMGALGLGAFASLRLASMAARRSGSSSSSAGVRDVVLGRDRWSTNGGSEACHEAEGAYEGA